MVNSVFVQDQSHAQKPHAKFLSLWTPGETTASLGTGDPLPSQHVLNSKADWSLWFGGLLKRKESSTILGKEPFNQMAWGYSPTLLTRWERLISEAQFLPSSLSESLRSTQMTRFHYQMLQLLIAYLFPCVHSDGCGHMWTTAHTGRPEESFLCSVQELTQAAKSVHFYPLGHRTGPQIWISKISQVQGLHSSATF